MPRPRRTIRPIKLHVTLPEDLVAWITLQLWSDLQGKIPHGKMSQYFERLVREDIARVVAANQQEPADGNHS